MPCDLQRLVPLARNHGLVLIEDAACAIGSEILWNGSWEKIGRPHADIACFSFHPRKVVTTGDGGMLTTANPEYDRQFRLWRQHSMSVSDTARHGAREVIFESYPEVGFNYRMTDVQAAIGRVQLTRLPDIIRHRRQMARTYADQLRGVPGVECPTEPVWVRSNWQSYCVRVAAQNQIQVMQAMLDAGISTRRGVMCSHREAPYQGGSERLPHSECAQDTGIILPLHSTMTNDDVVRVVGELRQALEARR
jgi:dTDP-4-amino-4,6-dideoxygalactose transaminase